MATEPTVPNAHHGAYPAGKRSLLLAYAFRPFFLLLPIYLIISIVLWGLQWGGVLGFGFYSNPLEWHIYEMLFGLAGAGIAGFLLTALPEFFVGEKPVVGKPLLALLLLWLCGRVSFWAMDWLGVYPAAISHLGLMVWLALLVYKPILADPLRRHQSLLWILLLLTGLQVWFFAVRLGWLEADSFAILKLATGAFMLLILQVLRRVNIGVINELLEYWRIDDVFLARPPRYNLAMLTIVIFSCAEYFLPNNTVLAWLGFAVAAALLNLLNDFLQTETRLLWRAQIWPLWSILLLMAAGYGLMGWDYLHTESYHINHWRHVLTTGALGLAYLLVLLIVTFVHTGRVFAAGWRMQVLVGLVLVATLLRVSIVWLPTHTSSLYLFSAWVWAAAFAGYLYWFAPFLWQVRQDGLPG